MLHNVVMTIRSQYIRSARQTDQLLVRDMIDRLTPDSLWLRYRQPRSANLSGDESVRLTSSDQHRSVLVAVAEESGAPCITAIGELIRDQADPSVADIAMVVRDDCQGRGIGTLLGAELVKSARLLGIRTLRADVLAGNVRLHRLIRRASLPCRTTVFGSDLQVLLDLTMSA